MTPSEKKIYPDLHFPEGVDLEKLRTMPVAVMVSGGVESASLVCVLKEYFSSIQPVYVRFGLAWERIEHQYLQEYLYAVRGPQIKPLKVLDIPITNVYEKHWSVTGLNVPDIDTPHEADYLPGRNLLLLTQTAVWCALNQISYIALGTLGTNPFPDASDKFFIELQNALSTGLDFGINILRPYSKMLKEEVILFTKHLPLHLGFSCISPVVSEAGKALHCGICKKCGERQQGFIEAKIIDQTIYAASPAQTIKA